MPTNENSADKSSLMLAFAPLHREALGLASGVVLGGLLFIATLVQVVKRVNPDLGLGLLKQFFWGYSVSLGGAFIGLLWAFGLGFALGWGFSLFRNLVIWVWLTAVRSRAEMDQYSDFLDHL